MADYYFNEKEAEFFKEISQLLRIISNPHRLAIIRLLEQHEKLSVNEIQEILNIKQSMASQYLRKLTMAGVLNYEKNGKNVCYFLKNKNIIDVMNCLRNCVCNKQ